MMAAETIGRWVAPCGMMRATLGGSPHWVRSVSQRDVVDLVGLAPPEGVISW
jgi:hypothetical protein